MLFKNITLIDEKFDVVGGMYVGTVKDTIEYIGSDAPADIQKYGETYDGKEKLLMPAFYNAHSHLPTALLRGYCENLTLEDWLFKKVFPFEDRLTPEDMYRGSMLSLAEMIRFGAVSCTDMYFMCDSIVKAVVESGAKINFSAGTSNFENIEYKSVKRYEENKKWLRDYQEACDGRIRMEVGLHAEYTSSDRFMRGVAEYANEEGLPMHVHVSETRKEHEECKARHNGLTPLQYLDSIGVFANGGVAAHCVYIEGEDFDILKKNDITVATCPKSNLKLASGVCDVRNLYNRGINVALATDGSASNNNLNMLEEAKIFSLIQKARWEDSTLVSPKQAIYAATAAGAKAQGRAACGKIKVGNKADLTVFDTAKPYMKPVHKLLNNLIYSACGTDVVLTMCDGKVLYRDGEYTTIDIEKTMFDIEKSKNRIIAELAK